jgi:hypothetical protein
MTDHDRPAFVKMLQRLSLTFGRPIDDGTLMAFFEALKDLGAADLEEAARQHCRTGRRWPVPADLRDYVEVIEEKRAKRERDALPPVVYRGLSPGDKPATEEQWQQFLVDLKHVIKTIPGPERRPHNRRR